MLIESWVLCYLIYIFLILIFLLCARIRQSYNVYPVIDKTHEFSYLRSYLIAFNDLRLPFSPSENNLLKIWQSFYLLRDAYKMHAFQTALRRKFDMLIEQTMWFLSYYNEKPILDQILIVVQEMPNISVDIESACQMLAPYSANPSAQKIIRILNNSNKNILTYEQNQNIEMLFYFAFIVCVTLFTCLLKIYRLGFHIALLEQYHIFGRAVPLIYLLTIIAPIVSRDKFIGRLYYYIALSYSMFKLSLGLLSLIITLYKYTGYFQGYLFFLWLFLPSLLFQYWILSYLILFYNRGYMISKTTHFGFISFLFCLFSILDQFIFLKFFF